MDVRTAPAAGTAAWLAALLLAASCAASTPPAPAPGAAPDPAAEDEFTRRAEQVVAAWHDSGRDEAWRSGFRPLEPLTVPPLGPLPEQVEAAISAGWLRAGTDLPADRPDEGEVAYHDGGAEKVPVLSAAEAFRAIASGEPACPPEQPPGPEPTTGPEPTPAGPDDPVSGPATCAVLTVTGARFGTVSVRTSRGPAEVPAWLFDLAGTEGPLARVAVAPEAVAEVPRLDGVDFPYQEGLATAMRLVAADGPHLTFTIGIGACDVDPAPLVHETAEVVVVGGTVRREPGTTVCTDELRSAEVTVTLDEPLGSRPVLATTGEVMTFGRW